MRFLLNFLRNLICRKNRPFSGFFLFCFVFSSAVAEGKRDVISVYFSPEDRLDRQLISLIEQEKESIWIAVYNLTHKAIASALLEAKERGVDVQLLVDKVSVKKNSPLGRLVEKGVLVYVWDGSSSGKGHRSLMHHKFCVFGSKKVWTGSFNFTYEASSKNQENACVVEGDALALRFKEKFHTLKIGGAFPYASYLAYHTPSKKVKNKTK